MRLETLAVAVYAVCAAFGAASSCVRTTPAPQPGPTVAITAEPPQVAPDAGVCPAVCARAQTACRKAAPSPVGDCVAKCRDDAKVAGSNLSCLAVIHTCNEDCP